MRPEREVVVLFAREPCEVEDNYEVNPSLVRPAVREKPLQLRAVGGLCAFAFFPEPLENLVALSAAVLFARTKLRGQAQILSLPWKIWTVCSSIATST